MPSDEEIVPTPAPEEGGSSLDQVSSPANECVEVQIANTGPGLVQDTLARTIQIVLGKGVSPTEGAVPLLLYEIKGLEERLKKQEQDNKFLQEKVEKLQAESHAKSIENERLKGILRSISKIRILQQCLQTAGAIGMGLSLKSLGSQSNELPIAGAILSAFLLFAGWLWPNSFKESK